MSEKNAAAVGDLNLLLEKLCAAKVEFILVGGLAAVAQGVPVHTVDIDIVPERSSQNIDRLLRFLSDHDARYRRPDDKIIKPSAKELGGTGHVLLMTNLGPIDVLGTIENNQGYAELLPQSTEILFRGAVIQMLRLEVLADLKRDSTEPKDQRTLPLIEEALAQAKNRED